MTRQPRISDNRVGSAAGASAGRIIEGKWDLSALRCPPVQYKLRRWRVGVCSSHCVPLRESTPFCLSTDRERIEYIQEDVEAARDEAQLLEADKA